MYEAVKYLANDMREADRRINRNFPMDQGANFFLFSLVDELRFDILDHGASKNELFQIASFHPNVIRCPMGKYSWDLLFLVTTQLSIFERKAPP